MIKMKDAWGIAVEIIIIIVAINLFHRQMCSQDEEKDLYQMKHLHGREEGWNHRGDLSVSKKRLRNFIGCFSNDFLLELKNASRGQVHKNVCMFYVFY